MDLEELKALQFAGKYKDALQEVDKALAASSGQAKLPFALFKVHIHEIMGDNHLAREVLEEHIDQVGENDINLYFRYHLTHANIEATDTNHDTSLEKLLSLSSWINREGIEPKLIAIYYTILGNQYLDVGNTDKAVEIQLEGLNFCLTHGVTEKEYVLRNNLANMYLLQGKYDLAKEAYLRAMEIVEELGIIAHKPIILTNIGRVEFYLGDYSTSIEYLEQSLKMMEDQMKLVEIETVYYMILAQYYRDKQIEDRYLEAILEFSDISPREQMMADFARALKLSTSPRIQSHLKAREILDSIIAKRHIDFKIRSKSIYLKIILMIDEMVRYDMNTEIAAEIQDLLQDTIEEASQREVYTVLATSFMLKAKFELINNNTKAAKSLLNYAISYFNSLELQHIATSLSAEYDEIRKLIADIDKPASVLSAKEVYDRLDFSLKYEQKQLEKSKIEREEPMMLALLDRNYTLIWSRKYTDDIAVNEFLVGNFISAMNLFSKEIMDDKKGMDRIFFGENAILFNETENLVIGYLFKGSTSMALTKLDKIRQALENDSGIKTHGKGVYLEQSHQLEALLDEVMS